MKTVVCAVLFQTWKKFGAAERDPPGPNPANTILSEEIFMQFVNSSEVWTTDLFRSSSCSQLFSGGSIKLVW